MIIWENVDVEENSIFKRLAIFSPNDGKIYTEQELKEMWETYLNECSTPNT